MCAIHCACFFGCEVIEKQFRGARGESFVEFLFRAHFYFDRKSERGGGAQSRRYSTGRGNVIVLNQNGIEETDAMIGHATSRSGLLLRHPQTGRGLARIEDAAFRMGYLLGKLSGESGNT